MKWPVRLPNASVPASISSLLMNPEVNGTPEIARVYTTNVQNVTGIFALSPPMFLMSWASVS